MTRSVPMVVVAAGLAVIVALVGCEPSPPSDEELQARVETALESASDFPGSGLEVQVTDGVVSVRGSLACEDCGGQRTPGGIGTVQQSLGAVVRAVPGVERVEFFLTEGP